METRHGGILGAGLAALLFVVAFPISLALVAAGGATEACTVDQADPSSAAREGIPASYLRLYIEAGREYEVPWQVLAAIGSIESDHGRMQAPGVTSGENYAGAGGPMQFLQPTWDAYGVDGDGDGDKDRYDPDDAIPGAANYLSASGAKGDLRSAIFAYNHADWYVNDVLDRAARYGAAGPEQLAVDSVNPACEDLVLLGGGGNGKWQLAPGANRPGVPLTQAMVRYMDRVAGLLPRQPVVTTGTDHSQYTTTGGESDHWDGNAVDLGSYANDFPIASPGSPPSFGDQIAAAALVVAGMPHKQALETALAGGSHTIVNGNLRVQVIWRADVGGNHWNHVHIGIEVL